MDESTHHMHTYHPSYTHSLPTYTTYLTTYLFIYLYSYQYELPCKPAVNANRSSDCMHTYTYHPCYLHIPPLLPTYTTCLTTYLFIYLYSLLTSM